MLNIIIQVLFVWLLALCCIVASVFYYNAGAYN